MKQSYISNENSKSVKMWDTLKYSSGSSFPISKLKYPAQMNDEKW